MFLISVFIALATAKTFTKFPLFSIDGQSEGAVGSESQLPTNRKLTMDNNIASLKLFECQKRCEENDKCVAAAYSYNFNSTTCTFYSSVNRIDSILNGRNLPICAESAPICYSTILFDDSRSLMQKDNVIYEGTVISNFVLNAFTQFNASTCQALCKVNSECKAASFYMIQSNAGDAHCVLMKDGKIQEAMPKGLMNGSAVSFVSDDMYTPPVTDSPSYVTTSAGSSIHASLVFIFALLFHV